MKITKIEKKIYNFLFAENMIIYSESQCNLQKKKNAARNNVYQTLYRIYIYPI